MGFSGKALTQMKRLVLCDSWAFTKSSSCLSLHPQESLSPRTLLSSFLSCCLREIFTTVVERPSLQSRCFVGWGLGRLGVAESHLLLLIGLLVCLCLQVLTQTFFFFKWEHVVGRFFLNYCCHCYYCENHSFHFQPSPVPQRRFCKGQREHS